MNVIEVRNVTKIYRLYEKNIDRLKEALNPFKKNYHKNFYALKDISFEVGKGETVGIIGKNGSGKSTLLKIITGVLTATSGFINIKGRISSILELGAGFNSEYTGLENIYLNGTLMGYSKKEINSKIDDIIDFADIGEHIYQPVKTYSSGMFARLAFAVAINVDPDILIVDEALAVGDALFQAKCFHKFDELRKKGITVLFVSHDMSSVKKLCSRVLWINEGKMVAYGDKNSIISDYISMHMEEMNKFNQIEKMKIKSSITRTSLKSLKGDIIDSFPRIKDNVQHGGSGEAKIVSFFIKDACGNFVSSLQVEKEYSFHIVGELKNDTPNVIFGFVFESNKGVPVITFNNYIYDKKINHLDSGTYEAIFKFTLPRIMRGEYLISPAIASGTQESHKMLDWCHNVSIVNIINHGFNQSLIELEAEFFLNDLNDC